MHPYPLSPLFYVRLMGELVGSPRDRFPAIFAFSGYPSTNKDKPTSGLFVGGMNMSGQVELKQGRFIGGMKMWRPRIWRLYEGFRDCFEGADLLDDLAKILNYTNEMVTIIEGYRGRLHPVLVRTFVLDNFSRIEEFARAYVQHVGASTMKALCDELRGLLEGVENYE
jgi:hypothetical protein